MHDAVVGKPLGRYVLHDPIATGGMGTVHVGRLIGTAGFRRVVAIKRVSSTLARDDATVQRFQREAAITGRLMHPNIVSALDVVAERDELFLVMELVRGESLSKLLAAARQQGQTVPVTIAAGIMNAVLLGLHAAHEATDESGAPLQLVHQDVSPQNILVGVDGSVKLADFGIASSTADRAREGARGALRGKARYLAPEQLGYDRTTLDRRVDLFAAANVLWEMLAGRPLFVGEDLAELVEQILTSELASLRSLRADIPPGLDELVARALQRDPSQRPADAAAFAAALETQATLASARAIGSWVRALCGPRVDALDAVVRRIETTRPGEIEAILQRAEADETTVVVAGAAWQPAEDKPVPSAKDEGSTRTLTVDALPATPRARPTRRTWPIAAVAFLASACVAVLLWASRGSSAAGTDSEAAASAPSVAQSTSASDASGPAPAPLPSPAFSSAPASATTAAVSAIAPAKPSSAAAPKAGRPSLRTQEAPSSQRRTKPPAPTPASGPYVADRP